MTQMQQAVLDFMRNYEGPMDKITQSLNEEFPNFAYPETFERIQEDLIKVCQLPGGTLEAGVNILEMSLKGEGPFNGK